MRLSTGHVSKLCICAHFVLWFVHKNANVERTTVRSTVTFWANLAVCTRPEEGCFLCRCSLLWLHEHPGSLFLGLTPVRSGIEKIVRGYIVKSAEGDQMAEGHFVGAPFIAGVHCLGCTQYFGDLRLGQIVVFPKSTQLFDECPHGSPPLFSVCP